MGHRCTLGAAITLGTLCTHLPPPTGWMPWGIPTSPSPLGEVERWRSRWDRRNIVSGWHGESFVWRSVILELEVGKIQNRSCYQNLSNGSKFQDNCSIMVIIPIFITQSLFFWNYHVMSSSITPSMIMCSWHKLPQPNNPSLIFILLIIWSWKFIRFIPIWY